jgi:hypothetical protein
LQSKLAALIVDVSANLSTAEKESMGYSLSDLFIACEINEQACNLEKFVNI